MAAILLAAVVVGGLGTLVWALVDHRAVQRDAVRTQAVLGAASTLEASAVDLETGTRGFAITSNPDFLAPWRQARADIPTETDALRNLVRDPGQRVRVERLAGLIRAYEAAWSIPIVEVALRDSAATRAEIARGGGKRRMDEIRAGFSELLSRESVLAADRRERSESAADLALGLGLACALGSALLIMGFAAYLRGIVVTPIRRVARAAERFADGDRSARAMTGGTTELDLLARSFNDMAVTVEAESAERGRVEAHLRANEREQDALRTVATAVAAEGSAPELFALVAKEAGRVLDMEMAGVSRFVARGPALVEGAWSAPGAVGDGAVEELWGDAITLTGEATIFGAPSGPGESGDVIGVAAPIRVGQRLWGTVAAATTRPGAIDPAATEILSRFAELVSLAVSSAEAREQLSALASTDALTGLPNLRTFSERLGDEVVRARRHGRPLSLMMIDIDHFKLVNDTHGHDVGNQVLTEVARRLSGLARGEDTVARVGGEEFAWILPESDARGAYWVAERARAAIAETPFRGVGHLTISAGVCEMDEAAYPDELFRRADAALYEAKAQGRNITVRWSPDEAATPIRSSPGASM